MRLLAEIAAITARPDFAFKRNRIIHFNEVGSTGFGDRLRGISLLLFISKLYNTRSIYYSERSSPAFPWKLTDLISIDGLDFISKEETACQSSILEISHNCARGTTIKRFGYKQMHRLRAKPEEVQKQLNSLPLGIDCIGLHIRTTDSAHLDQSPDFIKKTESRVLESIRSALNRYPYTSAYLACDSLEARNLWSEIISKNTSLQIICNSAASYDRSQLRQTGANDMISDFFALSECGYIIRSVPSEFSRFAAIKGGLKMKYNQLEGSLFKA